MVVASPFQWQFPRLLCEQSLVALQYQHTDDHSEAFDADRVANTSAAGVLALCRRIAGAELLSNTGMSQPQAAVQYLRVRSTPQGASKPL